MNRVAIESKNHKYATTYGGRIHIADFTTDFPRKETSPSWANRIVSDWAFDNECRKNIKF